MRKAAYEPRLTIAAMRLSCNKKILSTIPTTLLFLAATGNVPGQVLPLPPREADAISGSTFAQTVAPLSREDREHSILVQVMRGNVPGFFRTLVPVSVKATIDGTTYTATYYVTPDYLAIGSDEDYFLCPITPLLAQRICDALSCTLPTRLMVNQIWTNATVKLPPAPIAPSPEMITMPVFDQHNATVRTSTTGSDCIASIG